MRIAIPVSEGKLAMHFGHCERFALIDVDPESPQTMSKKELEAPEHAPGVFPRWLADQGTNVVIAGGMGASARNLLARSGITVLTVVSPQPPEALVAAYMEGTLATGNHVCDH